MRRFHKKETRELAIALLKNGYSSNATAKILNEKLEESEKIKGSTIRYWRTYFNAKNAEKIVIIDKGYVTKPPRSTFTEWNLTSTSFLY